MKISLLFFFLCFFCSSFSQSYLEFKKFELFRYSDHLAYVLKEIDNEKKWSPRKVSMICLQSSLLNSMGEYEKSDSVLHSIPENETLLNLGPYYLSKAILHKYHKKFEASYKDFKKAQSIFRRSNRYGELADAFIEEAEFHRKFEQFEIGLACIDRAEKLINEHKLDQWINIKMLNRYAAIANEYPKTDQSSAKLSKLVIELAKKEKAYFWMAVSHVEVGVNYIQNRQDDLAIIHLQLAENEFKKWGFEYDYINAKFLKACFHKRPLVAIDYLEEIIQEVRTTGVAFPLGAVYNRLTREYKETNNFKEALRCFELENTLWRASIRKDQDIEMAKIADDFRSAALLLENEKIRSESKNKETTIKRKQTQFYVVLVLSVALILFVALLVQNVLKRRRLNAELQVQNFQKDILIQEVHHRVKNNLQFVKSILLFQSTKSKEKNSTLNDISRRIDAISLVHEMLYSNDNMDEISLKEYLEKLLHYSDELYQNGRSIQTNLQLIDMKLPIHKLEAFGIICSELLSNSVKYAFDTTKHPEFTIELTQIGENSFLFHTYDNGTAMQLNENEDGLGLKMIDIYSRQLKGDYVLDRVDGYHYRLKFSKV